MSHGPKSEAHAVKETQPFKGRGASVTDVRRGVGAVNSTRVNCHRSGPRFRSSSPV